MVHRSGKTFDTNTCESEPLVPGRPSGPPNGRARPGLHKICNLRFAAIPVAVIFEIHPRI